MAKSVLGALNPRMVADQMTLQGFFPNGTATLSTTGSGGRFDNGRVFTTGTSAGDMTVFPWGTGSNNYVDTGDIGTNYTTGAVTCSVAASAGGVGNWYLAVGDTGVGAQLTFHINFATKVLNVYRGTSTGTALYSSVSAPLLSNVALTHNTVAVGWKIDPTAGFVYFRINGTAYVTASGTDNTRNTANTRWNRLNIAGSNSGTTLTDHVVVWDLDTDAASTLPVDARIALGVPTGDNSVQMTPNSGSDNWSRVDDVPYDTDSTYVSSATVGHKDIYDISSTWVPNNTTSIYYVAVATTFRKDDAATREARGLVKSGSSTTNGATVLMLSSYAMQVDEFPNDPATGSAWGLSALQAAKPGVEIIT